jgi:ABC-type branched-subunit amino acid transport system substrate-binding protein
MKPSKLFCILILVCLVSCVPKIRVASHQPQDLPDENLFSKAENLLEAKQYVRAAETYGEFIKKYPESRLVPDALMRTGTVYDTLGEFEKARNTYTRLINGYPKNNYIPDAKTRIIEGYLKEGLIKEAVNYSSGLLSEKYSDHHMSRIYILLGDAQTALNRHSDAVTAYFMAGLKSAKKDRGTADVKLNGSVARLQTTEIDSLIKGAKDDALKGFMQFQLGLRYYEKKNFSDAEEVLRDFTQKMPSHRNSGEAANLLKEIYLKSGQKAHTVGCLLPMTGALNVFGNRAMRGVETAAAGFSSRTGHKTNILLRDTASNPEKAATAADELIKEGVSAIIGPMGSSEAASAAEKAQAGKVPIVVLTQKENITDAGDFVFRNFLMPRMQVKSLVEYSVTHKGIKKFTILYPNENYGAAFMKLFQDEVKAHGGKIVRAVPYDTALTDFTDSIRILAGIDTRSFSSSDKKQKKTEETPVDFEAVFIPDSPAKAGLIIPQIAYLDIRNIYLMGTNLWHSQKMIDMAGEFLDDRIIIPDGFHVENDSDKMREFIYLFTEKYGEEPGFIEAVAYDTAMMLFQTMSARNVISPGSVRNELSKIRNYRGLTGITSFEGSGEARKKLYLLTVRGGRFVELKTD